MLNKVMGVLHLGQDASDSYGSSPGRQSGEALGRRGSIGSSSQGVSRQGSAAAPLRHGSSTPEDSVMSTEREGGQTVGATKSGVQKSPYQRAAVRQMMSTGGEGGSLVMCLRSA